jgi:hypothetical protein
MNSSGVLTSRRQRCEEEARYYETIEYDSDGAEETWQVLDDICNTQEYADFSSEHNQAYEDWLFENHDDCRVLRVTCESFSYVAYLFKLASMLAPIDAQLKIVCSHKYNVVIDVLHNVV